MSAHEDLAVIGVGQTPYRRKYECSTTELVQQAVDEALATAGVGIRDLLVDLAAKQGLVV